MQYNPSESLFGSSTRNRGYGQTWTCPPPTPSPLHGRGPFRGVFRFRAQLETEKHLSKCSPFPVKPGKGAGGMGFPAVFDGAISLHG